MSDEITTHEQPQLLGWEVIGNGSRKGITKKLHGRRYFAVKQAADEYCALVRASGHHPEAVVREVIGFEGKKP